MNVGMKLEWCPKPPLPLIPLGWDLPSMPGQGEYRSRGAVFSLHPSLLPFSSLGACSSDQLFFLLDCRYVIECPNCGVVYRSRQYWFGNQDPVDTVVRTEIVHIWPGVSLLAYICFLSF